jgi:hypothetical protein
MLLGPLQKTSVSMCLECSPPICSSSTHRRAMQTARAVRHRGCSWSGLCQRSGRRRQRHSGGATHRPVGPRAAGTPGERTADTARASWAASSRSGRVSSRSGLSCERPPGMNLAGALLEQSARFAGAACARCTPASASSRGSSSPKRCCCTGVPAPRGGLRAGQSLRHQRGVRVPPGMRTRAYGRAPGAARRVACPPRRAEAARSRRWGAGRGSLAQLVQRSAPAALEEPPAPVGSRHSFTSARPGGRRARC